MPFAQQRQFLISLALAGSFLTPAPGLSRGDPAALCRDAAAEASSQTGVPLAVLLAVAIVETGRNDQPWPWTVNFGGQGQWFDSAAEAATSVDKALRDGATNIDLGCFQLNYRWHAEAFGSIDDMLDPERNATYAAEYLSQHYTKTGDWALAAAAYHSATPEYARVYLGKFEATYARLSSGIVPDAAQDDQTAKRRSNGFPLLLAGTGGLKGSLFQSVTGARPLIGAP
ncbi:MAG: invasion protein [Xanthobacteraceae bacterium]|nr:MAG: invasion protein [Xanthobacteraceae bacterium]